MGDIFSKLGALDFKAKNHFFNQWMNIGEEAAQPVHEPPNISS
jgi:hypothetical protein